MKYVINIMRDVEKTIIDEVKNYFFNEVRFAELYPNFGNLRISGTHPFAFLIDQEINDTPLPTGLWPCITIVNDTEQKCPDLPVLTPIKDLNFGAAEVTDIEDNRDKYSISDGDLNALKTLTANDTTLNVQGVETYRRASVVIEIWSENPIVKNKIYDLMNGFLIGIKRFTIKENYNIIIIEESISGEKSGNYNYDFGKILYGAILRFSVDFGVRQYEFDTDIQTVIDSIQHTYTEVHNDE